MQQQDLISVIMPVYNSEKFIAKAVGSIVKQTYEYWELIIVDDGSTDNTINQIERFKDPRIKTYKRDHKGIVESLNFGLSAAKGKFIARMDADDICSKRRLEKQFLFLSENKDTRLVGTNYTFINESDKILAYKRLPENHEEIEFMMPVLTSVVHASILTYKDVYEKAGCYKSDCEFIEDYCLFLELLKNGVKFHNIQEYLYGFRMSENSVTSINSDEINKKSYQIGFNYARDKYNEKGYEYFLSAGLIEYYKGSMLEARSYLKRAKGMTNYKLHIWRYLLFTYLGDKIMRFMRRKKILWKISFLVKKITGIDFHMVRRFE